MLIKDKTDQPFDTIPRLSQNSDFREKSMNVSCVLLAIYKQSNQKSMAYANAHVNLLKEKKTKTHNLYNRYLIKEAEIILHHMHIYYHII